MNWGHFHKPCIPKKLFLSPNSRGLCHPDGHREAPKGPARGSLPSLTCSGHCPELLCAHCCCCQSLPGPMRALQRLQGLCPASQKSKCSCVLPEHLVFAQIRKRLLLLPGHTSCFSRDEHGLGQLLLLPCSALTSIPLSHNQTLLPRPCRKHQLPKNPRDGLDPKGVGMLPPHPHS